MEPPPASDTERSDLVRGLGLWSATAIVIGDTIGTGVFLVTSDMARAVGSATLVLVAWIVGGLIVLCGAFCYAELGAAFPKAGALTSTLTADSDHSGDFFLAG
jgi:APA family basic amino acid/polyamine antiporter